MKGIDKLFVVMAISVLALTAVFGCGPREQSKVRTTYFAPNLEERELFRQAILGVYETIPWAKAAYASHCNVTRTVEEMDDAWTVAQMLMGKDITIFNASLSLRRNSYGYLVAAIGASYNDRNYGDLYAWAPVDADAFDGFKSYVGFSGDPWMVFDTATIRLVSAVKDYCPSSEYNSNYSNERLLLSWKITNIGELTNPPPKDWKQPS